MKKLLLFLSLSSTIFINCKLHKDTLLYYSTPKTDDINQKEYHELVWACKALEETCIKNRDEEIKIIKRVMKSITEKHSDYTNKLRNRLTYLGNKDRFIEDFIKPTLSEFLQRIATPTSIRLLNDLQELNFNFRNENLISSYNQNLSRQRRSSTGC